jgi:hypothetical protein
MIALMLGAANSTETSVKFYHVTWRNNAEVSLNDRHCDSRKSHYDSVISHTEMSLELAQKCKPKMCKSTLLQESHVQSNFKFISPQVIRFNIAAACI